MQNKSSVKLYPYLFLVLSIIVIFLSVKSTGLPDIVNTNSPDTVFSAKRAYKYLQQIARAPHSMGTAEHEKVKDYIVATCQQLGFTVRIQNTIITSKKANTLVAANVYNIIATLRGTTPGKAILNAAHYDSQPNTPGAADDGMGVAGMIETARAVKALPPMKNDIVFLFTDGEEQGLLGAKAFTQEDSLAKNIGVAMNWDFRGNSGVTITYETSEHNGWLMRQYAKGAKFPLANSMGYEISRRMPNAVDFVFFKRKGITGYTTGVLGGYSYYHTLGDNLNNIEQRTMQQLGDNMLGMVKSMGNVSLTNTKAPNLSYFNLYGYWFIYYPSSLNIFFIILVSLVFIVIMIKAFRDKKINTAGVITGAAALPVTLAVSYFVSAYLLKWIVGEYPLYSHFYENNSYNSSWYFLAMMMLGLFIFSLIYRPIVKKWDYLSPFAGILFFACCCMWLTMKYTPSASWLLTFPLLFLLAGFAWILWKPKKIAEPGLSYYLINFMSTIPVFLFFAPLTYLIFLSFGLSNKMPVVTTFIVLIAALVFPVLSSVFKASRWLFSGVCIAGVFITLLLAHFNSGYDKQHPIQTDVAYRLNTTDSTAVWVSKFKKTDKYSDKFFENDSEGNKKNPSRLINAAPVLLYRSPVVRVEKDTLINNERELTLFCNSPRAGANTMGIIIDENTLPYIIDVDIANPENVNDSANEVSTIQNILYYGVSSEGFLVKFTMKANSKLGIRLYDQSLGLPEIDNFTELPFDVIPSPGFRSNTTRIVKHFLL